MVKEIKAWQIMEKQKHENEWHLEKFLTGGKAYFSFSEAQYDKNALKNMASSFDYKVVRIQ